MDAQPVLEVFHHFVRAFQPLLEVGGGDETQHLGVGLREGSSHIGCTRILTDWEKPRVGFAQAPARPPDVDFVCGLGPEFKSSRRHLM